MDFHTIRPIISGLIGATIAGWLAVKLAKRLPHAKDQRRQRALLDQQRSVIRSANVGAGLGMAVGLLMYFSGFLNRHDWRGLGVAFGLAAFLPLCAIVIGNLRGGRRSLEEGFAAYAIAQKSPAALLYTLMGLMVAGGVWAALSFLPAKDNAEQAMVGNPAGWSAPVVNSDSTSARWLPTL